MRPPVVILRHPRERLSKCSLEPLRGRWPGLHFIRADPGVRYDARGHLLLTVDAPALGPPDARLAGEAPGQPAPGTAAWSDEVRKALRAGMRPLLLLDATWRLLPQLGAALVNREAALPRSLPPVPTAYPRVSKIARDPEAGLASVEALYLALRVLGHNEPALLADYPWRERFLAGLPQ